MTNSILNYLELKPAGHYSGLGLIFDIYIDGQLFLKTLAEYETRFGDTINGSYQSGLGCRDVMNSLLVNDRTPVLFVCDCGEWECWFFQGQVGRYDDFVYWSKWSNPYRGEKSRKSEGLYWDYGDFPVLCFDRRQYQEEVERAQALVHEDPISVKLLGL